MERSLANLERFNPSKPNMPAPSPRTKTEGECPQNWSFFETENSFIVSQFLSHVAEYLTMV